MLVLLTVVMFGLQILKEKRINRNFTTYAKAINSTSSSLLHVPVSLDDETLDTSIEEGLSFATEKLDELDALRRLFNNNDSKNMMS